VLYLRFSKKLPSIVIRGEAVFARPSITRSRKCSQKSMTAPGRNSAEQMAKLFEVIPRPHFERV
jgi:hypothetical protein